MSAHLAVRRSAAQYNHASGRSCHQPTEPALTTSCPASSPCRSTRSAYLQVRRCAGANEKTDRVKQRDDDRRHESRLSENVRNLNRPMRTAFLVGTAPKLRFARFALPLFSTLSSHFNSRRSSRSALVRGPRRDDADRTGSVCRRDHVPSWRGMMRVSPATPRQAADVFAFALRGHAGALSPKGAPRPSLGHAHWQSILGRLGRYLTLVLPEEATMWFKKPQAVVCVVCGKTIAPSERRFVEKNRATKTERHMHVECSPHARSKPSSSERA